MGGYKTLRCYSGNWSRKKCEGGGVVTKLIEMCKRLLKESQEALCARVLHTLCRLARSSLKDFGVMVGRLLQLTCLCFCSS